LRWYIDSSAIIKLIKPEAETKILLQKLPVAITTSKLSRVEVIRTINLNFPDLLEDAYDILVDIPMVAVDHSVLLGAENLPAFIKLRALDSIHMATAFSIKNEIEGVITYDKEMVKAAVALGFKTMSPGVKL
jgi:predicted nucleic acid-binding protein